MFLSLPVGLPVSVSVVVGTLAVWLVAPPLAHVTITVQVVEGSVALPVLPFDFTHIPAFLKYCFSSMSMMTFEGWWVNDHLIFLFHKGVWPTVLVDTLEDSMGFLCTKAVQAVWYLVCISDHLAAIGPV